MSRIHDDGPEESQESLWWLTAAPLTWGLHFAGSYLSVSIWCGKIVGADGSLGDLGIGLGVYTAIALAVIAFVAEHGLRRSRVGQHESHDFDTPGSRSRFLGFATVLLAGVSAIATIYGAFALWFVGSCG